MSEAPPIVLTGASSPVATRLLERTRASGIRVLAVSGRGPRQSWPHVTWFEHDLDRGPADVRAGTLVSTGALQHALIQLREAPGIGRVVALSTALTDRVALVKNHVHRANLRRQEQLERALAEACAQRDVTLTLLKPELIYADGEPSSFADMALYLSRRRWIALGRGGLRQPVHVDDLAALIVRCLVAGQISQGMWRLGGGETVPVAGLVDRVATVRSMRVRRIPVPAPVSRRTLSAMHLPALQTADLAGLFAHDLLPDDCPAREQLAWHPRGFRP